MTDGDDHDWTGDAAILHRSGNWVDLLQGPSERLMKRKPEIDDDFGSTFPDADVEGDSSLAEDFRVAEDDVDTKVC